MIWLSPPKAGALRRVGLLIALVLLIAANPLDAIAQQPHPPGCPPDPQLQTCRMTVDLTHATVRLDGFTPNSPVTVEVFDSVGGSRVYGPVTRSTLGDGSHGIALKLVPGNYVVATDEATSTQKTLEVTSLEIDAVDVATDVVSGTAEPGNRVNVVISTPPLFGHGADVDTDSSGRWTADFGAQGADIIERTTAAAHVRDEDGDATFVTPPPRCPPEGATCLLEVALVEDRISANQFSPNSDVRFEVFDSVGGRLLHTATRRTDVAGTQLIHTPFDLMAGNYVVVTDVATSFQKTLELTALSIESLDVAADTVSGTARPGDHVFVDLTAGRQFIEETVADANGVWTADFGARGADLDEQTNINIVYVFDSDGDKTGTVPGPGCRRLGQRFACVIGSSIEHDSFFVFGFSPNSEVSFEIFDAPGGTSLYGPVTKTTDKDGNKGLDFGLDPGPDIVPGTFLRAIDVATGTVKTLEVSELSIDRVDPATDVVEGRAPSGTTVDVNGFNAPRNTQVVADGAGAWRADFNLVGYDFTSEDFFFASVMEADGDSTSDQLGAPIPGCQSDADTTCGSAGPDTIREDDGEIVSGLQDDTVLVTVDESTETIDVDSGPNDDVVVVTPERRNFRAGALQSSAPHVFVRNNETTVLPLHAEDLVAEVFGTAGADRVETRNFGGNGSSSGEYDIKGAGGDDSLASGDAADTLLGGGGSDRLDGGSGGDVLKGGSGRDVLIGGPGFDTCYVLGDDEVRSCERVKKKRRNF